MTQGTVKLSVPFDTLAASISDLSLIDKRRLWGLLEEQIAQADEDLLGVFQFRGRHEHDVGAKHSDSAFVLCKVPLPNASPLLSPKVNCTRSIGAGSDCCD